MLYNSRTFSSYVGLVILSQWAWSSLLTRPCQCGALELFLAFLGGQTPNPHIDHTGPRLLKMLAVLQKALLKMIRCAVGVHFVSNYV